MKHLMTVLFVFSVCCGYAQEADSARHITDSTRHEKKLARREKEVAPWFVERFKLSAGVIYLVNNTNVQVGVDGNPGTDINMEKDLGFNKELGTFVASAEWRISRRSRITLSYYNVKRNSSTTLQKDIIFDDKTFYANSSVNSQFNTTIYQFSYGYAILSKPTYEAGLLIGTHVLGAKASITEKGNSSGTTLHGDFGFTAPLPDLGIWGGVALSKRFSVNMDISYFALTLDQKTGRVLAFDINFSYKLLKQLDLSLGYSGLDFKVNATKNDVNGQFKWGFNGPLLSVDFSFGKRPWKH